MRGKSSKDKCFDGRVEDGAAGGQGVPCRTGGCAHQDPVRRDLSCPHATDEHLKREDLARKVPDHQNVVDSCRREDLLTLPHNAGLKDEAVLHRVQVREDSIKRRIDLVLLDVCEKTERAQIDTEDRQSELCAELCSAQEGPVTAQAQNEGTVRRSRRETRQVIL